MRARARATQKRPYIQHALVFWRHAEPFALNFGDELFAISRIYVVARGSGEDPPLHGAKLGASFVLEAEFVDDHATDVDIEALNSHHLLTREVLDCEVLSGEGEELLLQLVCGRLFKDERRQQRSFGRLLRRQLVAVEYVAKQVARDRRRARRRHEAGDEQPGRVDAHRERERRSGRRFVGNKTNFGVERDLIVQEFPRPTIF